MPKSNSARFHDSTDLDRLRRHLDGEPISFYVGFDPTAPSLHVGHLMQLNTARRMQQAGHRPLLLVGGATGQIGDPKEAGERILNSPDVVAEWRRPESRDGTNLRATRRGGHLRAAGDGRSGGAGRLREPPSGYGGAKFTDAGTDLLWLENDISVSIALNYPNGGMGPRHYVLRGHRKR